MKKSRYLTAAQAAAELGITPATLYAYVSRGMIRSEADWGRPARPPLQRRGCGKTQTAQGISP